MALSSWKVCSAVKRSSSVVILRSTDVFVLFDDAHGNRGRRWLQVDLDKRAQLLDELKATLGFAQLRLSGDAGSSARRRA